MHDSRSVAQGDGVDVVDVACTHGCGRGEASESVDRHAIVFVRRGCFSRTADGVEALLDPTVAYCVNPQEEQRYDHPLPHGDDCTAIFLSPELTADFCDEGGLPRGPLPVDSATDLEHRLLVRAASSRAMDEVRERAIGLVFRALGPATDSGPWPRRQKTARAHFKLAQEARGLLAAEPNLSLGELASVLSVSPHHLSRVFRAQIGHPVARQRIRLRVRAALERISEGDSDLARVAADAGFSDQSHLCRAVRSEMNTTPSALREILDSGKR
jgi:AraC-like DNA-binding protein